MEKGGEIGRGEEPNHNIQVSFYYNFNVFYNEIWHIGKGSWCIWQVLSVFDSVFQEFQVCFQCYKCFWCVGFIFSVCSIILDIFHASAEVYCGVQDGVTKVEGRSDQQGW